MENDEVKVRLGAERVRLQELLRVSTAASQEDRKGADAPGYMFDSTEVLAAEGADDSVTAGLRQRLAAFDRAEQRLGAGTYERSLRSRIPIPADRLEANPAAELTAEEAEHSS